MVPSPPSPRSPSLSPVCPLTVEKSYDRDTLTSDIVCHGGMVVGSPLEVGGDMEGVFCVSDGPCRKRKFLLALAVGVPCVSFHFVLECVQKVSSM